MRNIFSTQNLGKKRVLVVDDNIDNALLLSTLLETEGYLVDVANCGYTAISKIEANPPNIVLLDLIMPIIDGIEVARWIRKNRPSVAVVLVTAYSDLDDLLPDKVKFDGIITKPLNFEETILLIQNILEYGKQPISERYKSIHN
ncbi:response regulator [Calothrix sp. HK-06]|nr:response regulator [Calothrix sp. HK-06]